MSERIQITLDHAEHVYQPRTAVTGQIQLSETQGSSQVAVRLYWLTHGVGSPEIEVVDEQELLVSGSAAATFKLELPDSPISFTGELITLEWAIEAVLLPEESESASQKIIVSSTGSAIQLKAVKDPKTGRKAKWGQH